MLVTVAADAAIVVGAVVIVGALWLTFSMLAAIYLDFSSRR